MKDSGTIKIEQLDALTGLRGFAALWVASLHFIDETNTLLPASSSLNWIMGAGANAVPLFFVLSGFILLHTYRDQFEVFSWRKYFHFLGLRLARIYPAYLAALAAMVALVAASSLAGVAHSQSAYPLRWLLPEALMLHNWVLLPPNFFGWNYPDWSVSAEWFAYLFIFPLAVWLLKRFAGENKLFIAALALALCALEPALRTEWKLSMVSLLFLVGALLWDWRRRRLQSGEKVPPQLDTLAVGLLLVVLWFTAALGTYLFLAGVLVSVGLLILGLSRADGIFSRLLATRVCVFLGEISYSIYLVHGIVQRLMKIILPAAKFSSSALPVRTGVWLADVTAVLIAALLLYFAVERPARVWLRRKFARRQT
jgi:peptidoglycan/LPS O-acetylase OafA/YrhL